MHGHISGLQLGIHIHLTEKKIIKKRQAVRHLQICKPLHPNLSIHIFHTILYCLTIICYFHNHLIFHNLHEWFRFSSALLWGEIRCWSPLRQCEFLVQYFTDMQNCLQFLGDWQGWYCNESIWLIISLVSILSMMLHGNWVHCKFSSLPKGFFFRFLISLYQQNSTFQIPIQQVENSGQQSTLSGCPC